MQLRKYSYFRQIFKVLALFSISYTITSLYSHISHSIQQSQDAAEVAPFHHLCYYATETSKYLSTVNESPKPEDSLFFHETSCQWSLQLREACSVESAARTHPNRQVYVVFSRAFTESDCRSGVLGALNTNFIPNVHYHRVDLQSYAQDTPLQHFFTPRPPYWLAKWHHSKVRELLKYLTLYKFGGTVVDLDLMVVGSLDSLGQDWSSRGGEDVKSEIVSVSRGLAGKFYARTFLESLTHQIAYDGVTKAESALKDALSVLCNTADVSKMNRETCEGFRVYNNEFFNPGNWNIKANKSNDISGTCLGYHLWNEIMWDHRSTMPNDSLYASLARKHCPVVYHGFMSTVRHSPYIYL